MIRKRLWFGALAIPLGLAVVVLMGAIRSHTTGGTIDPTCTSSLPCIQYKNTGTGNAIEGIGVARAGIHGETLFNSTSLSNATVGIRGEDLSTSGTLNSGVGGNSVRGTGVSGNSTSGPGVRGESRSGPGVSGSSASAIGIIGSTSGNGAALAGVVGVATSFGPGASGIIGSTDASFPGPGIAGVVGLSKNGGTGVLGEVTTSDSVAVLGDGSLSGCISGGCTGVIGIAGTDGNGVIGTAPNDASGPMGTFALIGSAGRNAVALWLGDASTSSTLIIANGSDGHAKMSLDDSGNMILAGTLTQHGTPLVVRRTAQGVRVGTYSSQQTMPTVEDFGKGQLINGQAYVSMDPGFAATIDPQADYLVFLTPRGDNRGLYVERTSPAGFWVRESQSGRSTLAFDYRIVARPYGSTARRLPLMPPPARARIPRFGHLPDLLPRNR
jgi:hypothetical protein